MLGWWHARGLELPEMNSLGANGAVQEASKAALSSRCGCSSTAICLCGSEERSEAAEDTGAGAERHVGGVGIPLSSEGFELSGDKERATSLSLSLSCEVAQPSRYRAQCSRPPIGSAAKLDTGRRARRAWETSMSVVS